jgi:acyl-CoA thioesterase FadM
MHDEFPESFAQTFQIRYDECGRGGALRAAVHLRLFQEIAFAHSASAGFPPAWYEQERLFWVVRRLHLVVHAAARHGDALTYSTRVVGARRVMARRVSTAMRADDGSPVATGETDWIFTRDGAAPSRIDRRLAAVFPAMSRAVTPVPVEEPAVPPETVPSALRVRVGDLDSVGHVNNPVYVDLLDDAVVRAGGEAAVDAHPRTYDMQFAAAIRAGDMVRDLAWREGGRWHYRLERQDGGLVIHGRLSAGEVPFEVRLSE